MRSARSRFATTIIAGLFIAAACTSAATPAPDVTPTASPSITITPASPSPSATAQPTAEPTPLTVPPKPTGVTFDQQVRESDDGQVATITQIVRWGAPLSQGVEIRVYGVTECIAEPADPPPGTSGPCLVVHTPLPASVRTLLATVPASDGVVSWTWTQWPFECDTPNPAYDPDRPYRAIVLAAYGASDHSIFAIAHPGGWWRPEIGDIIC
jgi:hypothetical protein